MNERVNRCLRAVEYCGFVAIAKEAKNHICAHAAEADHTELEF
jgi:hypothetical protein